VADRSEKLQSGMHCVVEPVDACLDAGVVLQIALPFLNYTCYLLSRRIFQPLKYVIFAVLQFRALREPSGR